MSDYKVVFRGGYVAKVVAPDDEAAVVIAYAAISKQGFNIEPWHESMVKKATVTKLNRV